jgi:phosphate transport system ATP-binding protein
MHNENSDFIEIKNLTVKQNETVILKNINMNIPICEITSIIGPSDSGKSILFNTLNRMIDFLPGIRIEGDIRLADGTQVLDKNIDTTELRKRIGLISEKPAPFPVSVLENLLIPLKSKKKLAKQDMFDKAENAFKKTGLWQRIKDNLKKNALTLSATESQLLCISRALVLEPEILLLDQPTSFLDPVDSVNIEEILLELQSSMTIIIITHNIQQAARISSHTGFLYRGELLEYGPTNRVFTRPENDLTDNFIKGKFG